MNHGFARALGAVVVTVALFAAGAPAYADTTAPPAPTSTPTVSSAPTSTAVSTPAATGTQTPAPTDTATPAPTDTPTQTPAPTDTPTQPPTPTAAPLDTVPTASGSISGTVTDAATGAPLTTGDVTIFDQYGNEVTDAQTDATGAYSIGELAAGDYTVQFVDWTFDGPGHLDQWWQGATTQDAATPITITDGQQVTGIDAALQPAGEITGTIVGKAAVNGVQPLLSGMTVTAYDVNGNQVGMAATTGDDGTFTIGGLPSGSYTVQAGPQPWLSNAAYTPEWYSNSEFQAGAKWITVTAGAAANIRMSLAPNGAVSGGVVDENGAGIPGVSVTVLNAVGTTVAQGSTDDSGQYSISGLGVGAFTVTFQADGYLPPAAVPFTMTAGGAATLAAVTMRGALTLTGTVTSGGTPVAFAVLTVTDASGGQAGWTSTGEDGSFTVSGLPAGVYSVAVSATGYLSTTVSVVVAAGTQPTAIELDAGATIRGVVRASIGGVTSRVAGAMVELIDAAGNDASSTAMTNDRGAYSVTGLSPDTDYWVYVTPGTGDELPTWAPSAARQSGATAVHTGADGSIVSRAVTLRTAATITGHVFGGSTGEPLANLSLSAIDPAGHFVASAQTDASGAYTLNGLGAGTYRVFVQPGDGYLGSWIGGAAKADALTFTVKAAGTIAAPDAVLTRRSGQISGAVTFRGAPLTGITVEAYDAHGALAGSVTTTTGGYTLPDLAPGAYTVFARSMGIGGFANRWYGGATESAAKSITVRAGMTTGDTSIALTRGASIAGIVSTNDNPPTALAGEQVSAFDADGNDVADVATAIDGRYLVGGLAPGDYRIEVQPSTSGYPAVWYGQAWTEGTAQSVTVAAGQRAGGRDIRLVPGATIDGTVQFHSQPLAGVSVSAIDATGDAVAWADTSGDGTYSITGLAPGAYRLQFRPTTASGAADQWYRDAASAQTATRVDVTVGQVRTGADVALHASSSISGTVRTASGHALSNVRVNVFVRTPGGGLEKVSTVRDGAAGQYTVGQLPAGRYVVQFVDDGGSRVGLDMSGIPQYRSQYWSGATSASTAKTVVIGAPGTHRTGIDATLIRG